MTLHFNICEHFLHLSDYLSHSLSLSLFLSLCLSFSQLDKGQGLQWSNINEDGFVVYVDRWEKFKRIKNSICQQVDEGKWATGWLVSLATWGDTLSASRRVRKWSRRWQLFIINCAAKWRRLYDKNHYNKFSACLIVKQEKSSSQSAPFPRFPFPTSLFPVFALSLSLFSSNFAGQLIMTFILVHCQNQTLLLARLAAN